ncbi:Sensor histidine kinase HK [Actinidia chinensis var. chinensis]|uniref:Sensor histidine kinase HK n=1 Tax=Actinidia chinensis var. chinensis TaxID=1590841 RepID=A0A2R6QW94_ACTCC|nr:Sensor histidine kinase HK [Actinidia chinensis var. chinensis]
MESHIQILPNSLSFASITIATVTLLFLFLQTPENCIPKTSNPKPTTNSQNPPAISRIALSTPSTRRTRSSGPPRTGSTRVLCVSAGAGHEVMAMKQIGLKDVSGVELVDSPPLVSCADPHNLPFFDGVFDLGFSAQFDRALFPWRYAAEMERTVRAGGACVVAVEACGDAEVREVASLFRKSRFVMADSVTLTGT